MADARRAPSVDDGLPSRSGEEWYETACCHSGLAGLAGSGVSAVEGHSEADRAMGLIRKAIGIGYRDFDAYRTEAALGPLRDRDDFRLLTQATWPCRPTRLPRRVERPESGGAPAAPSAGRCALRHPARYSPSWTQATTARSDTYSSPAFLLRSGPAGRCSGCVVRTGSRTGRSLASRESARQPSSGRGSHRTVTVASRPSHLRAHLTRPTGVIPTPANGATVRARASDTARFDLIDPSSFRRVKRDRPRSFRRA